MNPFQTLFDAQESYFAKSMLISPLDMAIGLLFPPYTSAKNQELKQWLDY